MNRGGIGQFLYLLNKNPIHLHPFRIRKLFRIGKLNPLQYAAIARKFDAAWGNFLRKERAGKRYAEFAAKLGVSESTLFRYETGEQSVTLGKMEEMMRRLGVSLADVFGDEVHSKRTRRD